MKTQLFLIFALLLLACSVSAQNNKASVSLTAAIYEEEVSGNLNKAINLYLDILKKYPDDRQVAAKTLYHLGLINEKMGEQKANEYFKRLVNTYPDQTEMVTLAKEKLTLYNSVAAGTTLKAEQSFKLASELFKQLKYEEAVTEYEKVIKLVPKSQMAQEAQLWIGHCYFRQGKNEQALKSFNAIVKEFPGSNLVPVSELMISQVKQATGKGSPNRTAIVLDDMTILDSVTGIKFTKINSWAGENDIVKAASSITDIFPNRKFLLAGNIVVPFDNSDSFTLNDSLYKQSKLSPDGTKLAFLGKNSISLIPVSPVTGRPTGPAQKILDIKYQYGNDIHWSPDGNNLIFSLNIESGKNSIWTFSTVDHSLRQVTTPYAFVVADAIYSKSGSNFLYRQYNGVTGFNIKMKPIEGKSVTILDSCAGGGKHFVLSPDNKWIIYTKMSDKKMLYFMSDKQEMELSPPLEVGDFVSWSDDGSKAFFYRPSAEKKDVMKVATVFGVSAFEIGASKGGINLGWSPDSREIIVVEGLKKSEQSLKMINLTNQTSKYIDGIVSHFAYSYLYLSPDCSKVLVRINRPSGSELSIVPISLKESKVTGKSIIVFKNHQGYGADISWSSDGKKIAICNAGEVWICNTEGGPPLQLTNTPIIENFPSWSPDGNAISVNVNSTNQLQILKSSDGEVLKTFEKVDLCDWDWNPDGKEITIAFLNGQLNAVSLVSGKSRKIANWKEITHCSGLYELKYSPDGKWIALNGYQNDQVSTSTTFIINAVDGKALDFAINEEENPGNIKWSPDSKWISYSSYGTKKARLESILWEADLTDFMKKMKPGTEKGYTTDFNFNIPAIPEGGIAPDGTFTDARDGHVYKYKKIGTQTWMAENLAFLPEVYPDSATSFVDKRFYVYGYKGYDVEEAKNTENFQKFGVLYNWKAAVNNASGSNSVPSGVQGICPSGWHLPSDAEWIVLEKTLGMSNADLELEGIRTSGYVHEKLKSPFGWDDDDIFIGQSGFNALPGGSIIQSSSRGLNSSASFWTSTSTSLNDINAWNRILSFKGERGIFRDHRVVSILGNSVRCVKDE